jgi:hypothetical protein
MQPLLVAIGLLGASYFLLMVMYWWSEGMLNHGEAFIFGTVYSLLIVGLFASDTLLKFLMAFIPLVATGAYMLYQKSALSIKHIYKERIKDCVKSIQEDPRNLAAREILAETYYNIGELDKAIAEIKAAVDLGGGPTCRSKYDKYLKQRRLRDTTNPVCTWCDTENPKGEHFCRNCGSPLPYNSPFTKWLTSNKAIRLTINIFIIISVVVSLSCFSKLEPPLNIAPFALTLVLIMGWGFVNSARK